MKVLLLSSAFSGLTQRVLRELLLMGHDVEEHYDLNCDVLRVQLNRFQPDVVLCPFLTQRIPSDVWRTYLCLVVHPGIEGDRGPSSLDWAISDGESEWGVTLLQADEDMDAGDIWGTKTFPLRRAGKTSIYKREVSSAAVALIRHALANIAREDYVPRPLDYQRPQVLGTLHPLMKQAQRKFSWSEDSNATIVAKINAADTNPGVLAEVCGHSCYVYGAVAEPTLSGQVQASPGSLLSVHQGALCIATAEGAVWVKQLKCKDDSRVAPIKLPAGKVLSCLNAEEFVHPNHLQYPVSQPAIEEIRIERQGDIAYLYFDFYNGAASTRQCLELKHHLRILKKSDVKMIVFMGGEDFWSNGIHLNVIEASESPAQESWANINAIDDLVYEMINCPNQITISALRNNAGAGGAIMALACDEVIIRQGVVLNPHYQSMGLFGSEFWTYLLPKRVGDAKAQELSEACEPMLAIEALELGVADRTLPEDWDVYHDHLRGYCRDFLAQVTLTSYLNEKAEMRAKDESKRPLNDYRKFELTKMRTTFFDPNSEYHDRRRKFVYKIKASATQDSHTLRASA